MSFRQITVNVFLVAGLVVSTTVQAEALDELLTEYSNQGAGSFSSEAGETLLQKQGVTRDGAVRRCTSCHGEQLAAKGKHFVTGKTIEPLAPSSNTERLSDRKKVEKWFRRNCKWTYDRECTAQEKGDFLTFLRTQ